MRQNMKKDMTLHTMAKRLILNGSSQKGTLKAMLLLVMMMTLGVNGVWGQTHPKAGIWYMQSQGNTNYYMVPADNPKVTTTDHVNEDAYFSDNYSTQEGDSEKPFITTYPTNGDLNSIWIFVPVSGEDNYYYIVHAKTGKYVKYQQYLAGNNNRRKFVHLETMDTPGETEKFEITELNRGIKIKPKNNSMYLNIAGGNQNQYNGGTSSPYYSGIIGGMSGTDNNSQFNLTDASSALTPVISDLNEDDNTFTITSPAAAFSTIHYTTDGNTTPDANTGMAIPSGSSITITSNCTVQAVGVFDSFVTPVVTKRLVPSGCVKPVITYDNTTSNVSIICATPSSTIYYTTDGGEPNTSSTEYSAPFSITSPTIVKAIATHTTLSNSAVAEFAITQVATPTIQDNGSNAISITSTTEDATIYYTTDGSTPTTESTEYTNPLTDNISNVTIKAIAVKDGMINSAVGSGSVKLKCATPIITREGMTFTISCTMPKDATFYYRIGDGAETLYNGPVSFTTDMLPTTITAVAQHNNYTDSESASMELINGTGTAADPYMIYGTTDFATFVTNVNNGTTASACYKLGSDVSASGIDAITTFTGTFDGDLHTITGLSHPLFNTVSNGTVKNVILDNVTISGNGNVGAICSEATGNTRIYNCGVLASNSIVNTNDKGYTIITSCSSSISGSNYVGGLVGLLDGAARVINCFSYANIISGSYMGGIVGYNNVATTSANLKTMVMNCMFYGDITGGENRAPIYNGKNIVNQGNTGVGNYNYFWAEASYVEDSNHPIDTYNCALMAETRYLQRFEFFRHLLNGHRDLAAWWATGSYSNKGEMAKWVLAPSQIGTSTPYPILKSSGYYPSVVNIDAENATTQTERNKGGKLGDLAVTIQMGSGGDVFGPPTGAAITESSLTLPITDKDFDHFNFNYYKVQLPYYNDVGTKNYNGNRVVTGWKITSISTGTHSFTTGEDATATVDEETGEVTLTTPYNYADRNCTDKDLYSVSGRVFNQGAYWDVPEGVTAITIQPYWAKAAYVADSHADVVYNAEMDTPYNVGSEQIFTNSGTKNINGEDQTVYTSIGNAVTALAPNASNTVNDYAVVLVGNYHQLNGIENGKKPYTVTSIDLDHDNEPDYSFMLRFNGRTKFHPVKYDFINLVGLGMAQKSTSGKATYNFGIPQPKYWFETTNTSLFRVTQFEYDHNNREASPIILQGGVMEQWVSGQNEKVSNNTTYFHVGGNVWFKEFHLGCHQDRTDIGTKHSPVSVTGGDYDEFYLTGLYAANTVNSNDNAECYINGGRFGIVAGAGMEGIGHATNHTNGNITWQIDNADITEFYGGGINGAKPIQGNITTVISNSHVHQFCGGPKFGDMYNEREVRTSATKCTFDTYFGAGYGGNSYNRQAPFNYTTVKYNIDWNKWVRGEQKNGSDAQNPNFNGYKQEYKSAYDGVSTQIAYQFLPMSDNASNVARLWIEYVKFSLATTHEVTSTLTDCTINQNFYGGGNLGKVDGEIKSTLTNCTVGGNVFGAGFSASLPEIKVMNTGGFATEPFYNENLGVYMDGVFPETVTYSWEHKATVNSTATAIDKDSHKLYTDVDISPSNLGSVAGNVTLTIKGNSVIGTAGESTKGNVYGGGESSYVTGAGHKVTINLQGETQVLGNVFGGGDKGLVEGSTVVNIEE